MSYCHIVIIVTIVIIVIYSYCSFNISISYLPQNFFPFPLSLAIYRNFAAWWSAARRASNPYMHHPEMANIPVASPLPANKNQAETAKCACTPQRCATMICFWIKNYCCPKKILSFTCMFHEKQLPLWRKQTPHYPPTLNPAALWQRNISTPKQT